MKNEDILYRQKIIKGNLDATETNYSDEELKLLIAGIKSNCIDSKKKSIAKFKVVFKERLKSAVNQNNYSS